MRRKPLSAQPEHLMPPASPSDLKGLYDQHSRMILRTAWRITGRPEDAEDVLQLIFLRLLRTQSQKNFDSITGGYLRRAAVNGALDIVRSRQARPEKMSSEDSQAVQEMKSADNPEDTLRNLDLADALCRAVAQLSSRAAEVFVLRDIEGLSNKEIAALLGTTPNTVTVTCHRARTRLMELLSTWEGLSKRTR